MLYFIMQLISVVIIEYAGFQYYITQCVIMMLQCAIAWHINQFRLKIKVRTRFFL